MTYIQLDQWSLLKHPFYRLWESGELPKEKLTKYAKEYAHHVKAFPRYISRLHSITDNIETRQLLLENLVDEEQGTENHPKLWAQFAESVGVSKNELNNSEPEAAIQNVIKHFFETCGKSPEEGLGALYAYESQIPEIAKFKSEALEKHYVTKEDIEQGALKFFEVHKVADVYHRQALEKILACLTPEQQQRAKASAETSAQQLWGFLDAMSA